MVDERHDDGVAEETPEDDAPETRCLACGGVIAEILLSLGSVACHDCRSGVRAA
jgi:hypothetical protein